MSLKQLKYPHLKVGTKLFLAFCLVLTISFVFLFSLLNAQLIRSYTDTYREFLNVSTDSVMARYKANGFDGTQAFLKDYFLYRKVTPYKVLFIEKNGTAQVLFDVQDDSFVSFDAEKILKEISRQSDPQFTILDRPEGLLYIAKGVSDALGNKVVTVHNATKFRQGILQSQRNLILTFVVLGILSALLGWLFSQRLTRPLMDILAGIKKVHKGDLKARVALSGTHDEIEEIKNQYNTLLMRIEGLVGGLKEAFDNLAHDIRTPVTRLRGHAEITLNNDNADLEDYRGALQSCYENSDKILSFLQNLTDIAEAENRTRNLRIQKQYIGDLVSEMVDLYEMAFEDRNIKLIKRLDRNDWAMVDAKLISRLIANLLDNAHKFSPEETTVLVETVTTIESVKILVTDEGPGIAAEEQHLIFDRLYRSDKSRTQYGMGLGLSFVKAVVNAHEGEISVVSPVRDGKGTRFEVTLYKMR